MTERILIAGSGGQGIITSGKILATAGVQTYEHVTFFPSYGAEVRGGMCNCQVILSADEIASPLPEEYDTMLIMNQDGYDAFSNMINKCGLVIVNSSLCRTGRRRNSIIQIPATETADRLGDIRVANFILLGAYVRHKPIVSEDAVTSQINAAMASKKKIIRDMNIQAFRAGMSS